MSTGLQQRSVTNNNRSRNNGTAATATGSRGVSNACAVTERAPPDVEDEAVSGGSDADS